MAGKGNDYADVLGVLLEKMPKNVLAAIAVSYASNGGDNLDKAAGRIAKEWQILYDNGIVPQKPNKAAYTVMDH